MHHTLKTSRFVLTAVCLVVAAAVPAFADEPPTYQPSFAPLIERVKPAVVTISTTELRAPVQGPQMPQFPPGSPFGEFFRHFGPLNPDEQQGPPLHALGSGFLVDADGTIVTNNHVVENGTKIEVTLPDGTTLQAKEIGHDELTDLAVLKVDAGHPLPYVAFGDSDKTQVGDWVVSVGNPFGLGGTVTAGIVSARGRDIHSGPYDDYLQIDAPINQGNSGGPTFNQQGQVIGINTAILSPNGGGSVGIGFAIPSNLAKPVVAELEKSGKIVRGWLGVAVQPIRPDMKDALDLSGPGGVLVASVLGDGPASRAGVKPGDVITAYNDQPIRRPRDLTWAVANTAPGTSVSLTIQREGRTVTPSLTVVARKEQGEEQQVAKADNPHSLGLDLQTVTPDLRDSLDLAAKTHGVVVVQVAPNSPADEAGLQPGDVVQQVNHTRVRSPRQVSEAINEARSHGKKSIALNINRNGQDQFVVVDLPPSGQS